MMQERWRDSCESACNVCKKQGLSIEAFYEDHFYSSGRRFGYPICIRTFRNITCTEQTIILGWAVDPHVCMALIDLVEKFIRKQGIQPS